MNRIYRVVWSAVRQIWVAASEISRSGGRAASSRKEIAGALAAALVAALPAHAAAPAPNALPTGGQVLSGQAVIAQSGSHMTVNQATGQAILNWSTFNIGANASVTFNQPSSSAVALNRVVGADPSAIYGSLSANGQVFLINPNGVLFAPGAHVDVGGLVASTLNIRNEDFLAGNYRFTRDGSTASVVNQGELIGRYIALLAPEVRNEGVIAARMGTVALAAGDAVTLTLTGNSLIDVQVDPASISTLIENRQMIQADAGTVILSAQSANQLLGQVVNSGTVEANGITADGGVIRLRASSTIANTGTLSADAGANGNGGTISVIADLANPDSLTTVDGILSAKGGSLSGNGGSIETSGHRLTVADTARIDTSAANGKSGDWLLDPYDFTIAASGGDITGAALASALGAGNVTIQTAAGGVTCTGVLGCGTGSGTNGDIIVNDTVSWQTGSSLTLDAYRNIEFGSSANLTFGTDSTSFPNGATIQMLYGSGGSGYAYAVAGSQFSGGGSLVDITNGFQVTQTVSMPSTATTGYIIGSSGAPVYVQLAGGAGTYGDTLSPVYSMTSGGTAMNINSPSGTATWAWTGGPGGAGSGSTLNNVGSYTGLTYSSGLSSINYSSFATGASASWTVTQRPITLTANDQSKIAGNVLNLGSTAFSLSSGTMAYSETVTGVTLGSANGYAASTTQGAGTYANEITISGGTGAGGFNAANYNITYVSGKLTITAASGSGSTSTPTSTTTNTAGNIIQKAMEAEVTGGGGYAQIFAADLLQYRESNMSFNEKTKQVSVGIVRQALKDQCQGACNVSNDDILAWLTGGSSSGGDSGKTKTGSSGDSGKTKTGASGDSGKTKTGSSGDSGKTKTGSSGNTGNKGKTKAVATLTVPTPPKGVAVDIFVAVVMPSSAGGGVYFKDAKGAWVRYESGSAAPYETGKSPDQSVGLTKDDLALLKKVPGAQVYVGYGQGTDSFNSMLNTGTYKLVDPNSLTGPSTGS